LVYLGKSLGPRRESLRWYNTSWGKSQQAAIMVLFPIGEKYLYEK